MKIKLVILYLLITASASGQQRWTLRQCIEHAIGNNVDIRQQEVARDRQKVEVGTAKFSRLPSLSGSVGQSFGFGRGTSPEDNSYINQNTANTSFDLSANVNLFSGRQVAHNIALAELNLKAATEDLNKAKEDISIQVTSAYLQVLFNEEISKVASRQVVLSREQHDRLEKMREAGKASVAEVYEAKSRLAQDEQAAVQSENNRKLALLDLSQLLELPSPDDFAVESPGVDPDFTVLTPPAVIYDMAVLSRPGVLAARYRLEGTEKSIRVAQSALYPQLSFGAGLSTGYHTISGLSNPSFGSQWSDNFSKSLGFTLSVPIFNRMETRDRVRSARLQQLDQSLQLENVKKTLYKEIQQAYYNAVAAQAKYMASTAAVDAAGESFRLMSGKYAQGKATAVEYNESKNSLVKSTSERIQAKFDYLFRVKILDFYKGVPLEMK